MVIIFLVLKREPENISLKKISLFDKISFSKYLIYSLVFSFKKLIFKVSSLKP